MVYKYENKKQQAQQAEQVEQNNKAQRYEIVISLEVYVLCNKIANSMGGVLLANPSSQEEVSVCVINNNWSCLNQKKIKIKTKIKNKNTQCIKMTDNLFFEKRKIAIDVN